MKTNIKAILEGMRKRHPNLATVTEEAFDSISNDDAVLSESYEPIALARKIAIGYGVDLDASEQDTDTLAMAFAELILVIDGALSTSRTSTTFSEEEDPNFDSEADVQAYEDELLKVKRLRQSLTSYDKAESRCRAQSGFWEEVNPRFHNIYAIMLIDLCQDFNRNPLDFWVKLSRG